MELLQPQVDREGVQLLWARSSPPFAIAQRGPAPPRAVVGDATVARLLQGGRLVDPAFAGPGGGVQQDDGRAAPTAVGVPESHAWKVCVWHDVNVLQKDGRA